MQNAKHTFQTEILKRALSSEMNGRKLNRNWPVPPLPPVRLDESWPLIRRRKYERRKILSWPYPPIKCRHCSQPSNNPSGKLSRPMAAAETILFELTLDEGRKNNKQLLLFCWLLVLTWSELTWDGPKGRCLWVNLCCCCKWEKGVMKVFCKR